MKKIESTKIQELKILVADDHPLMRKGMVSFLNSLKFENILEAENGRKALQKIKLFEPDIAFLDIEMPEMNGLEVAQECKDKSIPTKLVILSVHREPSFVTRAQDLNIAGYLIKDDALSEIENCIQEIAAGNRYLSSSLLGVDNNIQDPLTRKLLSLTPSERKILNLIARKMSTQEIAEMLFISVRTVEKHRSNMIRKLDLPKQTHALTQWVIENYQSL